LLKSAVFQKNYLWVLYFNHEKTSAFLLRGNHVIRACDIFMIPKPGHIDYGLKGTTHSTCFSYDTHAPLLMMGCGIKSGQTYEKT